MITFKGRFLLKDEAVFKERLQLFVNESNFQQVRDDKNYIEFKRGSILRNLLAANPASIKTNLKISLDNKANGLHINIIYEADITGQILLANEKKYLKEEFTSIVHLLRTGDFNPNLKRKASQTVFTNLWRPLFLVTILIIARVTAEIIFG